MNLNLRPMSEAPPDEWILIIDSSEKEAVYDTAAYRSTDIFRDHPGIAASKKFILLADVLAAVELLRKMTPEGYEIVRVGGGLKKGDLYRGEFGFVIEAGAASEQNFIVLRKLPEPVEYRYECKAEPREQKIGDWLYSEITGEWFCVEPGNGLPLRKQLCYRRVEVNR